MIKTILVIRDMTTGKVRVKERELTSGHFDLLQMKLGKIENGYMLAKIERV